MVGVDMTNRAGPLTVEDCESCFAALKERERDCLRLVARNYKTKEIARQTGLTEHTVNKIIFGVRRALDNEYRGSVGRLFIEWEARQEIIRSSPTPPAPLTSPTISASHERTDPDSRDEPIATDSPFTDLQQAYAVSAKASRLSGFIPLRIGGKHANHLTLRETLITTAILALAALTAVGSAVSLLAAFNGLYH